MKTTNQTGFSAIEALLVLVVVGIVGFTGWYVYHAKQTSDKNYSSTTSSTVPTYKKKTTTSTTVDQYAGWTSYTTKYEKLSFKYPSGWKLTDQSTTSTTDVTPGQDSVSLVAGNGLEVVVGAGSIDLMGQPPAKVLSSTPLKLLGGSYYLTFGSNNQAGTTTGGALVTTTTAYPTTSTVPQSKNITLSKTAVAGLPKPFDLISLDYDDVKQSAPHDYSLATFQQDPNYKTALLILESITQ